MMTAQQKHDNIQAGLLILGVPALVPWVWSLFTPIPYNIGWWSLGVAYVLLSIRLYLGKEEVYPALFLATSGLFAAILRLNYLFWGNFWLITIVGWSVFILLSIFVILSLAFPYQDDPGPAMDDQYNPDGDWLEPIPPPTRLRSHPRRT